MQHFSLFFIMVAFIIEIIIVIEYSKGTLPRGLFGVGSDLQRPDRGADCGVLGNIKKWSTFEKRNKKHEALNQAETQLNDARAELQASLAKANPEKKYSHEEFKELELNEKDMVTNPSLCT